MQNISPGRAKASVPVLSDINRVLRLKSLIERLGVGRSTVYDRLNPRSPRYDASFPKPIRLSSGGGKRGAVGWLESEVSQWIAARAVESSSRNDIQEDR